MCFPAGNLAMVVLAGLCETGRLIAEEAVLLEAVAALADVDDRP